MFQSLQAFHFILLTAGLDKSIKNDLHEWHYQRIETVDRDTVLN